ncbi:MAG: hypothetical protein EXS01_01825 [Phycisphaerales bacterium]|nr:hypothetical protein [Phycisphaerales bacterium]
MRVIIFSILVCSALVVCLIGCSNVERADRSLATKRVERASIPMDVDPIMRGTVASETIVMGYQPVVVRGYGFVTGLKGTGSRTAPAEVRQYILREMSRHGVGEYSGQSQILDPEALLSSDNTAIVIVEALIPAGAPRHTKFDVRVYAAPGTSTTSLEGGNLWTTDLRPGVLLVGSRSSRAIAEAKGPIIINPFADDSNRSQTMVNQLSGRVLNGGNSTRELPIRLVMATPSHSRTRLITSAINSGYPREPTQRGETAIGQSGEMITVSVPPSWRDHSDEFVELLRHTSVNVGPIDATATAIKSALTNNPGAAKSASLRWQALGPKSFGSIRSLYDYSEEQPRFAALQAGARLDDALVVPHLLLMATSGSTELRVPCIRLLERMSLNPAIDLGLRPLLNDSDIDVRLAAYEVLRARRDPIVHSQMVGKKFRIDVVPSSFPMIYVSQSGEPAIAIFDDAMRVTTPLTLRAWDGDLMFKGEASADTLEVFFRRGSGITPLVEKVSVKVPELIRFLGHTSDAAHPAPGLGMTFSQTIGAVHALSVNGSLTGPLKMEQDRILAAIAKAGSEAERTDRPEFIDDEVVPDANQPSIAADVVPGLTPRLGSGPPNSTAVDPNAKSRDTVPR